jgi:hypothetical protein
MKNKIKINHSVLAQIKTFIISLTDGCEYFAVFYRSLKSVRAGFER